MGSMGWASGPPLVLDVAPPMDLPERIEQLIGPSVEALGYDIVRVRLSGRQRPTLQVMTEPRDGATMTVDGCAEVSRAVAAVLDVEDTLPGPYTLEVSSPGLDRPLVRLGDFARFSGHDVKVELHRLVGGRRRFRGRLLGTDGDVVRIEMDGDIFELAHADIQRAKLVMSDELLVQHEEQ